MTTNIPDWSSFTEEQKSAIFSALMFSAEVSFGRERTVLLELARDMPDFVFNPA